MKIELSFSTLTDTSLCGVIARAIRKLRSDPRSPLCGRSRGGLLRPIFASLLASVAICPAVSWGAFSSLEFQPLQPGDRWTSLRDGVFTQIETVLPGTQLVNGVPTRVVEISGGPEDGARAFVTNDVSGLRVHRVTIPDPAGAIVFTPPATVLPSSFEIGTSFSGSGSIVLTLTGIGTFFGTYSVELDVVGVEQIVVPAGTFQAIRVDFTLTLSAIVSGTPVVSTEIGTDWAVRHLGPVQSMATVDGDSFLSQLVSSNLVLCGDVDDDGFVGVSDVILFQEFLAGLAALSSAGEAKCTTIQPPSECGIVDLAVIRRDVEGPLLEPGISQVCEAVLPLAGRPVREAPQAVRGSGATIPSRAPR